MTQIEPNDSIDFPADTDGCWIGTPPLSLADLRGRVVVLAFWSYGNVACHHDMAELARLQARFGTSVEIIGVHAGRFSAERLTSNVAQAVARHRLDFPVFNDADHAMRNAYQIKGWPSLVLIEQSGRVAARHEGEFDSNQLAQRIDMLLDVRGAPAADAHVPQADYDTPTETQLRFPSRITIQPPNQIFVADTGHHRLIQGTIDFERARVQVDRCYGDGTPGWDDGKSSRFRDPRGLSCSRGQLYVADTGNHVIRAIDLATQTTRTVAGTGEKADGFPISGSAGPKTAMRSPWAVLAQDELLYIAMAGSNQLWLLVEEQEIGPFAGIGQAALIDGTPDKASFCQPSDIVTAMGHLIVADAQASAVRAISPDDPPQIFTLVGQGLSVFGDQNGRGADVRLQHPLALAVSGDIVVIADTYNHKIKLLNPQTCEVRGLLGTGESGLKDGPFDACALFHPEGLAIWQQYLLIADTNNHALRIADLANGQLRTIELQPIVP